MFSHSWEVTPVFLFWLCKWKRLLWMGLKGFKSQLGKLWWYEGALPPIDYVVKWRTQLWSKASQPMFKGKMSFIESSKVEDSLDGKIAIPRVIYMHLVSIIFLLHYIFVICPWYIVNHFDLFSNWYVKRELLAAYVMSMKSFPQFLALWVQEGGLCISTSSHWGHGNPQFCGNVLGFFNCPLTFLPLEEKLKRS